MQQRTLFIALALFVSQWTQAASLSAALLQARLFLRTHAGKPPQADELAELKGQNPEAYAIVKALLTKRSLGLLNPRHPTASFAAPGAEEQQAAPQGPEVFEKLASPSELSLARQESSQQKVALPYAEVQPAAHHDWMNWKPQSSAMNDEQMVQNVLGAVAELKGKKAGLLSKQRSTDQNTLAADEASFGVEAEPAKPAAPPAAPRENSYLKSIDFGLSSAEKPAAPPQHENSYLKGIDLSGDMPQAVATAATKRTSQAQQSSNNYLASFSWDDSKPAEQAKPRAVKPAEPKVASKDKSLMAWLGVVNQAPTPTVAAAEPAKPSNPYLMDLS